MRSEFISEKLNGRIPNCTRKEYSEMLAIYYATEDRNKAKAQATYYLKGTKNTLIKECLIDYQQHHMTLVQ